MYYLPLMAAQAATLRAAKPHSVVVAGRISYLLLSEAPSIELLLTLAQAGSLTHHLVKVGEDKYAVLGVPVSGHANALIFLLGQASAAEAYDLPLPVVMPMTTGYSYRPNAAIWRE